MSGECLHCGIILEKYQDRAKTASSGASVENPLPATASVTVSYLRRLLFWSDNLRRKIRQVDGFIEEKVGFDILALFSTAKRQTASWLQDVLDRLVTLIVYLLTAWALGLVFLYGAKMAWRIYLETAVGRTFLMHFPDKYRLISGLLARDAWELSLDFCLMALQACLLVAAISRLLFVLRIFYEGRGILARYLLWPISCAAIGAWLTGTAYGLTVLQRFALLLVPAVILVAPCFELVRRVLPEANAVYVIKKTKTGLSRSWEMASIYWNRWR